MKRCIILLIYLLSPTAWAKIPATPVMTLYAFNGALDIPYYTIEGFARSGASAPAGTLAQGTSVIPCLVMRDGKPLTDRSGTPYVGFEIVVDARSATRADGQKFQDIAAQRSSMTVPNHHCSDQVQFVMSVRRMFELKKHPFFDPLRPKQLQMKDERGAKISTLDTIVRAFHHSAECAEANQHLIGRRDALARAWEQFIAAHQKQWAKEQLGQAKGLDYAMRTAIYEGHLDRGCSTYGACERNIIALSIRNRAREGCTAYQGCRFPGDVQGVASKVSQYNIWDEYLTQISGLTSCFLREDLSSNAVVQNADFNADYYRKVRRMYEQNVDMVEQILFGTNEKLEKIFPKTALGNLTSLRHYYHAPAMGKCFPKHPRVEYISGAIARNGKDFALIANTRIDVGKKSGDGYRFQEFLVDEQMNRDVVSIEDRYPGFIIDARKVDLKRASSCPAYGIPNGCRFKHIERYRRTPSWVRSGRPVEIHCAIRDRGEECRTDGKLKGVSVGGTCDTQMRPFAGVR